MYSKYKGITDRDYSLTPPPGYDGSRFRRRSDGRDDSFPLYGNNFGTLQSTQPKDPARCRSQSHDYAREDQKNEVITKSCSLPICDEQTDEKAESCPDSTGSCPQIESCPICHNSTLKDSKLLSYLQSIGSEEILLISLILFLAGSKSGIETETILILALLLCIS